MAKISTNMGFVRAIATWQPITKLAAGNAALENVMVMCDGDGDILLAVTDRYRLLYARVTPGHMETWDGKKLIPMKDVTDTVLLNKTLRDHETVVFDMADNEATYTITVGQKTVTYDVVGSTYPALENLLNNWVRVDTWPNDTKLNMKLLADLHKFANPNEGVTTAAKRESGWTMTVGESKAIRFHQGNMERFGVLFQPMTNK